MKTRALVIALFLGWLSVAGANQGVDTTLVDTTQVSYSLEPIVVTATRYPQPLSQVSPNFTLITSEQIDKMAGKDLGEVLGLCSGVHLGRYGGSGQLIALSMRGSTPGQILFLMDGRPLNSPQNGGLDLNQVPLSSVERVEVVRGGLSSLYGADAVGGVVNIITKEFKGSRPYSRIGFWQGDYGFRRSQFELGRGIGERLNLYLSGEMKNYGGYRPNSEYKASTIAGNLSYSLSRDWQLTFSSLNYKGELGVPGPIFSSTPNARQNDKRVDFSFGLQRRRWWPGQFKVQAYLSNSWQRYNNPDPLWPTYSTHQNRVYGLSFQGGALGPGVNLGVRVERVGFWSTDIGTTNVGRAAIWMEDDLKPAPRITLRVSSRLDHHTTFGHQFSPGTNLTYQIGNESLLFGSFNRSYRAPTANDLYWRDPYMAGNPDLRPERGWEVQMGFKTAWREENHLVVNFFYRRMRDLIEWEADPRTFKYTVVNKTRAEFVGEELSLIFLPISPLRIGAVYNLLWAEESGKGPLPYQPFNSLRLWFNFSPRLIDKKLVLNLWMEGGWRDFRYTERGSRLPPTFLLNSTLTISFLDLSVYLKGENLSNIGYQLRNGYPMPPRSFYGGLSWRFWD